MINANRTVAQITLDQPSAAEVFERVGIAYCCEGQKTLNYACLEIGLSAEYVVHALDDAAKRETMRDARNSSKTFEYLILRILRAHHERLRQGVSPLKMLASTAVERNRAKHPELVVIEELLQRLSSELTAHLAEEERNLFPALLQLELAYLGENPVPGYPKPVRDILMNMSRQHDAFCATLRCISAESNRRRSLEQADPSLTEFYGSLQRFSAEMHRDFHVENNVLFPQAAQMEAMIFRGFRSASC
jgi:regulator of cell morphogenesis and NO signaling